MNYLEALEYIHSVQWRGSKPGLSRTKELLYKIGDPHKKLKFVHIAGTNGKGSTSAMIASVLKCAGYKVGLYTSPFITRFNERIQFDGRQISDDELVEMVEYIAPYAEEMQDKPTEFELITAVAMEYYVQKAADIVVLEVGMGGELDSTNVIDTPEAAVITAIGLDHVKELGGTISLIASAKAGIIKQNGKVAVYSGKTESNNVFAEKCKDTKSSLVFTDFSQLTITGYDIDGCTFNYRDLNDIYVPLAGLYQPKNAALAIDALLLLKNEHWNITEEALREGLSCVRWPGRFEILNKNPVFILDGAHNPHGMEGTIKSLKGQFPNSSFIFLMGVMADKDISNMLEMLMELRGRFITVKPNNPRAMEAEKLAETIGAYGGEAISTDSIDAGVRCAIESAGNNEVICALGSLYFSGDVRKSVKDYYGR